MLALVSLGVPDAGVGHSSKRSSLQEPTLDLLPGDGEATALSFVWMFRQPDRTLGSDMHIYLIETPGYTGLRF